MQPDYEILPVYVKDRESLELEKPDEVYAFASNIYKAESIAAALILKLSSNTNLSGILIRGPEKFRFVHTALWTVRYNTAVRILDRLMVKPTDPRYPKPSEDQIQENGWHLRGEAPTAPPKGVLSLLESIAVMADVVGEKYTASSDDPQCDQSWRAGEEIAANIRGMIQTLGGESVTLPGGVPSPEEVHSFAARIVAERGSSGGSESASVDGVKYYVTVTRAE